jgi:hypothetical protein
MSDQLYTTEPRSQDYLEIEGLCKLTDLPSDWLDLAFVQELTSNAIRASKGEPNPRVTVRIDDLKDAVRLSVRNNGPPFSEALVRASVDFGIFASVNRNVRAFSPGHIGHGSKITLGLPVAVLRHKGGTSRVTQVIRSHGKRYDVRLGNDGFAVVKTRADRIGGETEVIYTLPKLTPEWGRGHLGTYLYHLRRFVILNPGVSFTIYWNGNSLLNAPAVVEHEPPKWDTSAYFHTEYSFSKFISTVAVLSTPASDLLHLFREGGPLEPEYRGESVGELAAHPAEVGRLFRRLRKVDTPPDPGKEYPRVGPTGLRARLEQVLGSRMARFHYTAAAEGRDGDGVPVLIETALAVCEDQSSDCQIVLGVNGAPTLQNFVESEHGLYWRDARKKVHSARSVFDIMRAYGIEAGGQQRKGVVVVVNLTSPNPRFTSYGKSRLDLESYKGVLARAIYAVVSKGAVGRKRGSPDETAIGVLRTVIGRRAEKKRADPDYAFDDDRLTQSSVWYLSVPHFAELKKQGTLDQMPGRGNYVYRIREVCEKEGFSREDLGIVASERAQLFYGGQVFPVSYDRVEELARMGIAILCIEKENFGAVFAPFATETGIAILNSRGFLEDYPVKLLDLASQAGAPVCDLTDYDVQGLYIHYSPFVNEGVLGKVGLSHATTIHRIGIDERLLMDFGLSKDDRTISVEYDTKDGMAPRGAGSPLTKLKSIAILNADPALKESLRFVERSRIELDSVLSKVGAKPFWDYVVRRMCEVCPNFNYNRAIDVDAIDSTPDDLRALLAEVMTHVERVTLQEREHAKKSLLSHDGILQIDAEVKKLQRRFKEKADGDDWLKSVASSLRKAMLDAGVNFHP